MPPPARESPPPWEQAPADLIIEGPPIRLSPTYRGQRNYQGLFWAVTNDRTLVYESVLELDGSPRVCACSVACPLGSNGYGGGLKRAGPQQTAGAALRSQIALRLSMKCTG